LAAAPQAQFVDGRRMRILVVVDDCTRECLALVPDTSIFGTRVARELDRQLVRREGFTVNRKLQ
jgi:putative transposase